MKKPKRSDDKYWTGTRNFDNIQYESDLEDYIIDLEAKGEQLNLLPVSVAVAVEQILQPKYANDVYTWKQIQDAIIKGDCNMPRIVRTKLTMKNKK